MPNLYDTLAVSTGDPARVFAVRNGQPPVTYGELADASGQYANALVACGVAPGDRVVVQVEKCIEMLFVYLGCLRVGAVFLPANPAYTLAELDYILLDADPTLLICSAETGARLAARPAGAGGRVETLETSGAGSLPELAARSSTHFDTRICADSDLASILYTSGTTGRPKGAMLTHGNLASNALTLKDHWHFSADDRLLHALPIFHIHGLFVGTNVTLAAGASMLFLPRFNVPEVIAGLAQCSVMMGVPTFYIRLLSEPGFDERALPVMRLFVCGSAPLSADVHREFAQRTGHAILERYGMTETNMNTSNPYHGERRAGSVGFPLPGVDIRITDEAGEPAARGTVGMIEIAGPNVFAGYWNLPDKTAEEFRGRFFVSGDLGLFDEDGYLHIVGRGKDLIISGGLNVYPAEVETALDELPDVRESAVIGAPHPDLGEGVVAVVAMKDAAASDPAALAAALRDKLARFKQPKTIIMVAELPRNGMGKIQKTVLRERYADVFSVTPA
jgi:malonyl-CoA/methylmalonyl-CoA synthetase